MDKTRTQISVLDHEIISGLRSILGEEVNELFSDFLEQAQFDISRLHQLFAEKNLEELSRIAHSLKGSSGSIGIAAFANSCMKLEHDAREGIESSIETYIHEIEADFEVAKQAITTMLAQK